VHRIGRTGRAGLGGIALSFCEDEEKVYLKDIIKLIKIQIPVIHDHPYKVKTEGIKKTQHQVEKSPSPEKASTHKKSGSTDYFKKKKRWGRKPNTNKAKT